MRAEVHVTERIAAYALGCLDDEEAAQVSEHLAACATCRAELETYRAVVDRLALAAPEAEPPAAFKARLMHRIEPRGRPVRQARPSWWQSLAGLFRKAAPAWTAASLVLIIALIVTNVLLWQALRQRDAGEMRFIALAATDAAPQATGVIVMDPRGEYGALVVDGLPPLDPEHQYQLWLVRDGERTSGGVFSVGHDGYSALEVHAPEPLDSYTSFGITIEPAGGSPGPTGPRVLGGGL